METVANQFTPLAQETRTAIPTDAAAHHLNRRPQTLRAWACLENGAMRPVRINGRLACADCETVNEARARAGLADWPGEIIFLTGRNFSALDKTS